MADRFDCNEKENIFKKLEKDQKIRTLISEVNALKINSAKKRSEEKRKASIEIANLFEENYKLSVTVGALGRSLNKRLCQNVTLKEENERHKNEKERLYCLLKYRVSRDDYLAKNTFPEIMTIVDRAKNLEMENIDLINKYQNVLNILESERENCVQLLKFMFFKTFLAKYSNNYENTSRDVSVLCKLENPDAKFFIEDNFNLNGNKCLERIKSHEKLKFNGEIITEAPLSNFEDLITVLIRLSKEKFLKQFQGKIDSTVHFQPSSQLNRINKTRETNFLSLHSRCKSDIPARKIKERILSNCQIIRIVHSNREINFPSNNIEYRNKNVNLPTNDNIPSLNNVAKWKKVAKKFIVTLNQKQSDGLEKNFQFYSPQVFKDEIFTSRFHDALIVDKSVDIFEFDKMNDRKKMVDSGNDLQSDNLDCLKSQDNSGIKQDSFFEKVNFSDVESVSGISKSALSLALRFTLENQNCEERKVLNLRESVSKINSALEQRKSASNLVETDLNPRDLISNLQESVLNGKCDSNVEKVLKVEEEPIKIVLECDVEKSEITVPNSVDGTGRKKKWIVNKSLSRIPVPLSSACKGLKETREKSRIQTHKKDLRIKEKIDRVSNINCKQETTVKSLSANETFHSLSLEELKRTNANKSKIPRRSKIPVRQQKINKTNFHGERKDSNLDNETNRITNGNLNTEAVGDFESKNFNVEENFQENASENVISKTEKHNFSENNEIEDHVTETENNSKLNNFENKTLVMEENQKIVIKIKNKSEKSENGDSSKKSEINNKIETENIKIEETNPNSKIETNTEKKKKIEKQIPDVDFENLDDSAQKKWHDLMRDQLSETLLLKRTNGHTSIDQTSTTQIPERSNKTTRETNPATKIVSISKISQQSKIQLENQESQTTIQQSPTEENFNLKKSEKLNKNQEKGKLSKPNEMIKLHDIKSIINSLVKSELKNKKFIIIEGKRKLGKKDQKGRRRKQFNSGMEIGAFGNESSKLKMENASFSKKSRLESKTIARVDVCISTEESHSEIINENETILRGIFENGTNEEKLNSIFMESRGNIETFAILSDAKNTDSASWISKTRSRSRQSNGEKEEKYLCNKVGSKEARKGMYRIGNCVGKSSTTSLLRGEEFVGGIQPSSESSKRVSDCKAHSEDFDSRKCTQMSEDSGLLFEKWTDEIEKIEAWNVRVKSYLSKIRMKLLLAEEKAEEESSVGLFQRNYSLGDRKELTLRNTIDFEDSEGRSILKNSSNVDLQSICRDMKRVTNIINNHTAARYLNRRGLF